VVPVICVREPASRQGDHRLFGTNEAMKTNIEKCIAVVLLSLFTVGCSSIRARTDIPNAHWTVYPGVRQDVKELGEIFSSQRRGSVWIKGLVTTILVVDLPFSAVFDTLAIPYDLYHMETPEARAEVRRSP
jgi:uncharacterized protein YceK